jgi:hypothetical protein
MERLAAPARMQNRGARDVPDPIARRDIVAYLPQESGRRDSGPKAKTAAQGAGY